MDVPFDQEVAVVEELVRSEPANEEDSVLFEESAS